MKRFALACLLLTGCQSNDPMTLTDDAMILMLRYDNAARMREAGIIDDRKLSEALTIEEKDLLLREFHAAYMRSKGSYSWKVEVK